MLDQQHLKLCILCINDTSSYRCMLVRAIPDTMQETNGRCPSVQTPSLTMLCTHTHTQFNQSSQAVKAPTVMTQSCFTLAELPVRLINTLSVQCKRFEHVDHVCKLTQQCNHTSCAQIGVITHAVQLNTLCSIMPCTLTHVV